MGFPPIWVSPPFNQTDEHTTQQPPGVTAQMGSRLEYLVRSKNRVVVHFQNDASGGGAMFPMDPSVFGPTSGEFATSGLTNNSAAISRLFWGTAGTTGTVDLVFLGATGFTAWNISAGSCGEISFERTTIPNLAAGATGLVEIKNNIGGATKTASLIVEFVTRSL